MPAERSMSWMERRCLKKRIGTGRQIRLLATLKMLPGQEPLKSFGGTDNEIRG